MFRHFQFWDQSFYDLEIILPILTSLVWLAMYVALIDAKQWGQGEGYTNN